MPTPTSSHTPSATLTISLLGFPAMLLMLAAGGAFHGRQDTSTPLALAVGGAVVNLVLESILIFGFGYGVGASALSTVIAQLLSAGVGVTMLMRWIRRHTVHRRPQLRPMLTLLKAGQALVLRTAALRGVSRFRSPCRQDGRRRGRGPPGGAPRSGAPRTGPRRRWPSPARRSPASGSVLRHLRRSELPHGA
ncbi:MAG: polysaccharide biosynthesis C-terminal domain-containing protein [Acidimicrobiales bacterium]